MRTRVLSLSTRFSVFLSLFPSSSECAYVALHLSVERWRQQQQQQQRRFNDDSDNENKNYPILMLPYCIRPVSVTFFYIYSI